MIVLSALDFKTDAALRRALKKETSDATVLIVTQRISTIMGAEQIVVLDNGEIAGIGTHKELMESCDVYREIALSQLSKEELVMMTGQNSAQRPRQRPGLGGGPDGRGRTRARWAAVPWRR